MWELKHLEPLENVGVDGFEMLENVVLTVCVNQFNKVKLIKNTKWKSDFVGFYE